MKHLLLRTSITEILGCRIKIPSKESESASVKSYISSKYSANCTASYFPDTFHHRNVLISDEAFFARPYDRPHLTYQALVRSTSTSKSTRASKISSNRSGRTPTLICTLPFQCNRSNISYIHHYNRETLPRHFLHFPKLNVHKGPAYPRSNQGMYLRILPVRYQLADQRVSGETAQESGENRTHMKHPATNTYRHFGMETSSARLRHVIKGLARERMISIFSAVCTAEHLVMTQGELRTYSETRGC